MQLQYVFGNPTGAKKRRKSVAKKRRVKRKHKNPEKYKVTVTEKTGKGKKRKVVMSEISGTVATKGELAKLRSDLAAARAAKATYQDAKLGASKAQKKAHAAAIAKANKNIKALAKSIKERKQVRQGVKKEVMQLSRDAKAIASADKTKSASTKTERWSLAKSRKKSKASRKKKKVTRKKSTKKTTRRKKATKKTTRRRRKKATKKATKKSKKKSTRRRKKAAKKATKKSTKKTTRRRRKKAAVAGVITKTKRYKKARRVKRAVMTTKFYKNPRKRGNPMEVAGFKIAGYDKMELAELGAGGLLYGVANSYISPMFAKIPGLGQFAGMLGGTIPSLMVGIALNIASDKISQPQVKKLASFLGDGLLGAAVVGAGVSLSQTLLPAALSGVDYYPGLDNQNRNYNGVDYNAQLSGVNYTPELMGAVDFSAGASLPGHNTHSDFGDYEQSVSDFGEIPDGLT